MVISMDGFDLVLIGQLMVFLCLLRLHRFLLLYFPDQLEFLLFLRRLILPFVSAFFDGFRQRPSLFQ